MPLNPLLEILILLASAVMLVPLFQRLGLGSVLGFLAAGVLVGPWGLKLITDVEAIQHLAEFGIIFLLFLIGIELKPSRLWRMRKQVFGFGLAQVLITTLILTALGRHAGLPPPVPLLIGSALALSSTAFVLQVLSERNELASQHGRLSFAILLLQDLAVVPLLALVPLLDPQERELGINVGFALIESAAIFGAVLLAGRYLLGPLFRHVAASRNSEVFTASALLLVLGTALIMEEAGLSMAMGAFIAGLLIADSEFRHQVIADISPFRGLLLGLFFMSVGMVIDFGGLVDDLPQVLLWLVVLLVVKALVLWPLAILAGLRGASALAVALFMAQGGEFGFVLFGVAYQAGLLEDQIFQRAILVAALSMALTPLLVRYADRLLVAEKQAARSGTPSPNEIVAEADAEAPRPVLIAGFGRVGRRIGELLDRGAQCGRVGYHADDDPVGVLQIHVLAAVLHGVDQLPGEPLANQVVGQLGCQHDNAGSTLGGCPTFFGLKANLHVVGVQLHRAVFQFNDALSVGFHLCQKGTTVGAEQGLPLFIAFAGAERDRPR